MTHAPLPDGSFHNAERLQVRLRAVLKRQSLLGRFRSNQRATESHRERGGRTTAPGDGNVLTVVLAELWKTVVEPVVDVIANLVGGYVPNVFASG